MRTERTLWDDVLSVAIVFVLPQEELERLLHRVGVDGPAFSFESETLEFKQADGKSKEVYEGLADAAVCFSNARGGTIVLGINDQAVTRSTALLGVKPEMSPDVIRKAIHGRTQPRMTVLAREVVVGEVRLIAIDVPGGLVSGVTAENILTHPSTPRHLLLADVVSRLQLAERTGQGVDRAYREMLRFGKEPPDFDDSGLLVRAVLRGGVGNDAFTRYLNDLPEELSADVDVLLALSALRMRSSISAIDLAPLVQRTAAEAQDVLARLADDRSAVLEPTRRTASNQFPSYRLRPDPLALLARAVSYRRRTMDQIDAKVIEHVQEYKFVTNRTIQRMLDVHVYGARDILSDLRSRGILAKLGDARGGPGVRYGPGPHFPRETRGSSGARPTEDEPPSGLF